MPFIDKSDQELLDPLSEKVSEDLNSFGVQIDRFKLKEFVYSKVRESVLKANPGVSTKALERLTDFQARLDYTHDLEKLVEDFLKVYNRGVPIDNSTRVQELEKYYEGIFGKEIPEEHKDQDIDKPIQVGGLTALHVAAQEGDLAEVKRLVEECGAKTNIRDNAKMTPKERAEKLGHILVASYLNNFS